MATRPVPLHAYPCTHTQTLQLSAHVGLFAHIHVHTLTRQTPPQALMLVLLLSPTLGASYMSPHVCLSLDSVLPSVAGPG